MGGCLSNGGGDEFSQLRQEYEGELEVHNMQKKQEKHTKASLAQALRLKAQTRRPIAAMPASLIMSWDSLPTSPAGTSQRRWSSCNLVSADDFEMGIDHCWIVGEGCQLWLGTIHDASDLEFMSLHRISRVVNCTEAGAYEAAAVSPSLGEHQVALTDDEGAGNEMFRALPAAVEYVRKALSGGWSVLVFCEYGVSRSATVVAACAMCAAGERQPERAIKWVQEKRRVVDPNAGFRLALESFGQLDVVVDSRTFARTAEV